MLCILPASIQNFRFSCALIERGLGCVVFKNNLIKNADYDSSRTLGIKHEIALFRDKSRGFGSAGA